MFDYLIKSLIYFLVISGAGMAYRMTHKDEPKSRPLYQAFMLWACVSLVPFARTIVAILIVSQWFVSNEMLNGWSDKLKEQMKKMDKGDREN